jgi:sarcosine oxidase subunit beta
MTAATMPADVLIIGGGLHGCAASFFLARRGLKVTVLEKDRIGQHASGRSAGGVRQLGRDFAEVPLSMASMDLWHELPRLLGNDGGFRVSGQIRVAETEAGLALLEERTKAMRERGFTHEELLSRGELFEHLPGLAPHCLGGLISRRDGFADPYKTTLAFAAKARELGVTLVEGARVTGIERADSGWRATTADRNAYAGARLLNAAGAWGQRVANALGDQVPLTYAPYMMTLTSPLPQFVRPVVIGGTRPLSFKQLGNGAVMIGGGYIGNGDLDGAALRCNIERLSYNVRTAAELFPILAQATVARSWCGLEGVMPDGIPVIGPSRASPDAFHAFGFCGHGFQLGPGVAALMAELIAGGHPNLSIEAFRVDRFADGPGARPASTE